MMGRKRLCSLEAITRKVACVALRPIWKLRQPPFYLDILTDQGEVRRCTLPLPLFRSSDRSVGIMRKFPFNALLPREKKKPAPRIPKKLGFSDAGYVQASTILVAIED
jgi:hypothetical protein